MVERRARPRGRRVAGAARDGVAEAVAPLIPGALFLAYIVLGETWSWTMRLRTRRALLTIDELRAEYSVQFRRSRAAKATV